MLWKDVSYVVRSKMRKSVLLELETPKTPTMLARTLKTSMPSVSRTLRQLEDRGLVSCLTPEERVGKIYSLTDKGKETLKKIAKMTQ